MANQGDVLVSKRRLGFGAPGKPERFVVVQADAFAAFDTALVVPLDDKHALYNGDPLVVQIPRHELGVAQVALPQFLSAVRTERFESAAAGAVSTETLRAIHKRLSMLLTIRG